MRKSKTLKPTLPRAINDRCTYRMRSRISIILQDPRVSDNPGLLHVHVEFLFTQISSSADAPNELGCELHQEQERLLRAKPRRMFKEIELSSSILQCKKQTFSTENNKT